MAWYDTDLAQLLGVRMPVVQAPMAGGWTTPKLVAAVSDAGGLGSLAAAMLTPDQLRDQIRAVRARTRAPFAVNVFAALPEPSAARVQEWSALTGVAMPDRRPAPRVTDQLAVVADERVPVLSFTFGIPPLDGIDAVTIGTATTVEEAVALERAGASAVVVQGYEAGGHRGTFLAPVQSSLVGTMVLVPQVVDALSVPVVAAGGIMDGRGIVAALALGAHGVQLGTAFLAAAEAATPPAYRDALGRETTITRVLTGRYARAVRTAAVDRLEASGVEPPDYPIPRYLQPELAMLAGQGGAMSRALPAAELMTLLVAEADDLVAHLGSSRPAQARAGTSRSGSPL